MRERDPSLACLLRTVRPASPADQRQRRTAGAPARNYAATTLLFTSITRCVLPAAELEGRHRVPAPPRHAANSSTRRNWTTRACSSPEHRRRGCGVPVRPCATRARPAGARGAAGGWRPAGGALAAYACGECKSGIIRTVRTFKARGKAVSNANVPLLFFSNFFLPTISNYSTRLNSAQLT